jgi:hypothetical protein
MSGNINFNGWLNDDGSENYKCRAWVNFNGTGTVAIRASGGVSSITDNGTGNYTVNFTTAMPDANYVVTFGFATSYGISAQVDAAGSSFAPTTQTTSQVRITHRATGSGTYLDPVCQYVAIFR